VRLFALAALVFAGLVAWALWPESRGPVGPSLTERAAQAGQAEAGLLSARVIPDDDLPPEGTRSLFDHLIAQNEGLPYPFEALLALLSSYDPGGSTPVALMIPDGRSLLKAQADFERPRVLAAPDYQAPNTPSAFGFAPRGRLFLGFVENAAEIEVISYNEAAGRFEFQLVQDYREEGVPRIVYARRAICTTCHQGSVPIFPQRPWSETNGQPEIAAHITAARGEASYLGLPTASRLAVPERFDELTDIGTFIPAAQRVWLDGCGEGGHGAACRRQMLKVALHYLWNPGGFDVDSADARLLRELQAKHWPAAGIAVAESDIRNRDPLAERSGVRGFLRALFSPKSGDPGARTNEDLAAFERLPKLPAELDPLTPRPPREVLTATTLEGAVGLATFFTRPDLALLEKAVNDDRARLDAAVARIPEAFFQPAPFTRIGTMRALQAALRQAPLDYAFDDTSHMSPPQVLGVPPLALATDSPLLPYERYCFACHRGNPAARLDFMAGDSEAEVLRRIKDTPAIRDSLDWERYLGTDRAGTLMPPADSHQRRQLEQAVAGGEPALEEMRKVVPGLFDF
jgi:hypothetical protein